MGTDYFADPSGSYQQVFQLRWTSITGWPQLDRLLYGGFSRGELNIFAGGSGSGKSLVMMNIALNWLQQGLSGVYITLELKRRTHKFANRCHADKHEHQGHSQGH
jgi:predicted ATP-dependent serine protease